MTKYLTYTQSSGQNCMQSMRACTCIFETPNIQCSNIIELLCGNEINRVNYSAMRGGPQFQIVESDNHKAMLADTPKRWFKCANAHQIRCYIQHAFSLSSIIQLNKANISDTEAPFLDLHLSVANGFVSSKIYDKRDDLDFDIVNFPFLDGDVPRRASYGVYISQLIRFARVCNHVTDFNARNKCLTAKLLQQGYRYHKLRKTFSKFYRRHYELISKYNVGLKTLLSEGLSEPEFYGDLVYKFKKLKGINDFSFQFRKIITRYRRIGYNLNVIRHSACLVFNPIMVDNYAAFFNCTPVARASDSMMAPT